MSSYPRGGCVMNVNGVGEVTVGIKVVTKPQRLCREKNWTRWQDFSIVVYQHKLVYWKSALI